MARYGCIVDTANFLGILANKKKTMLDQIFKNNRAISVGYAYLIADAVESRGGSSRSVLSKAGISKQRSEDFFSFINLDQYETLLVEALRETNDPALGLRLGQEIQFSDHGASIYSALSFPTLWEAFKVGMKYSKLTNQVVDIKLLESADFVSVRVDTPYISGSLYRTVIETVMSHFCETFRFMLNEEINSLELDFCYGEPEYVDQYLALFEPVVNFEAAANELRMPNKLAHKPQAMVNIGVAQQFENECDALAEQIYQSKTIPQQVHEALFLARGGFPKLEAVASQLNISARTLRRRLQESGTSYQKILDQVRLELANRYLSTTQLSIAKIAELLGYTDQNSFSHAYKQLSGIPPTKYRQGLIDTD